MFFVYEVAIVVAGNVVDAVVFVLQCVCVFVWVCPHDHVCTICVYVCVSMFALAFEGVIVLAFLFVFV